jgi:hypothetical protein
MGLGGGGGQTVVRRSYFVDLAVAVCEGPIVAIDKIWADSIVIYENGVADTAYCTAITVYQGTLGQLPDPLMEAAEGVGEVPAYRGTAYFVIEQLALNEFGGRVPNINAQVRKSDQALVSQAVEAIWSRSGREAATDIDAIWLQGEEVVGYSTAGPQSPLKLLEPLMLAFQFVAQERDGVLYFRKRKDFTPQLVSADMLAAREEGGEVVRKVSRTQNPDLDLPQRVVVSYIDYESDFQKEAQGDGRLNAPTKNIATIELPIVMSASDAKTIARRSLWSSFAENTDVSWTMPPSELKFIESDLLDLPVGNRIVRVRVTSVTRGHNFVLECKGVTEQSHTLTVTAEADDPVIQKPGVDDIPTVDFIPMDIPLLPGSDTPHRRFYSAVVLQEPEITFKGVRVYQSIAADGEWFQYIDFESEAMAGETVDALPAVGPLNIWDDRTSLTVEMLEGELTTKTELEVLAGQNHLFVATGSNGAGEIVAFCNAELIAPKTYKLRKLLRGRRDTKDRMAGHAIGDKVVLIRVPPVRTKSYDEDQHNVEKYYKAVPKGATRDDVDAVGPILRTSRPLKCFSPCQIKITRDTATDDFHFTWIRRSRLYFKLFSKSGAPMGAPSEKYEVWIYRTADDSHKRIILTNDAEATYTAAMQTTDGLTPGEPIYVVLYQDNRDLDNPGRGNASYPVYYPESDTPAYVEPPPEEEDPEEPGGVEGSGLLEPDDDYEDTSFNMSLLSRWIQQDRWPGKNFYDASFWDGMPDMRPLGFDVAFMVYDANLNRFNPAEDDPNSFPDYTDPADETRIRDAYRFAALGATGEEDFLHHHGFAAEAYWNPTPIRSDILVWDLEATEFEPTIGADPLDSVERTAVALLMADLMDEVQDSWADNTVTPIPMGGYLWPPSVYAHATPSGPTYESEMATAHEEQAPFIQKLQFLAPDCYVYTDDIDAWAIAMQRRVQECRDADTEAGGTPRPVYVVMAPHYSPSAPDALKGLRIAPAKWLQVIDEIMAVAEGVIIWGGLDGKLGGDPGTPLLWIEPTEA